MDARYDVGSQFLDLSSSGQATSDTVSSGNSGNSGNSVTLVTSATTSKSAQVTGSSVVLGNFSGKIRGKTSRKKPFPPVDEHLVEPEVTRDEMIKGRKVVVMGALPPHADAQVGLGFLLKAHVAPGYIASSELLTRVSEGSDFATDVSIRKEGLDPQTGQRYLEELSFEVVNEQKLRDITTKAGELARRGVRRIFAIFVKRHTIGEWSQKEKQFVPVAQDSLFVDPALVRPIPFKALLDEACAEIEVVKALAAKGNSEIARIEQTSRAKGRKEGRKEGHKEGRKEGRKEGLDEGKLAGRREFLLEQLEQRFGSVPKRLEERVRIATLEELRDWSAKLFTSATITAVFA